MTNQITQFTDAQLISELKRRHFRTDLLIGIADIDDSLGEECLNELTHEEKIEILKNLSMDSAQTSVYDQIMDELAPVIFGK
jgi:hypothetical protein